MEMINKDRVLAASVRIFFKYFVTGILESRTDIEDSERFEPKFIKQAMLDHYETVSRVFNKEVFFAIMKINFNEEEAEQ